MYGLDAEWDRRNNASSFQKINWFVIIWFRSLSSIQPKNGRKRQNFKLFFNTIKFWNNQLWTKKKGKERRKARQKIRAENQFKVVKFLIIYFQNWESNKQQKKNTMLTIPPKKGHVVKLVLGELFVMINWFSHFHFSYSFSLTSSLGLTQYVFWTFISI